MSGPNGHAHENGTSTSVASPAVLGMPAMPQLSAEKVKELVAALEVPFPPLRDRVAGHKHDQESAARTRPSDPVCRPASLHRPSECVVHSCGLDAPVHHSYQCEFRAKQGPEDCRESAGHL